MKAIILSGFLGAGKTTVLLQLVSYITSIDAAASPARIAILENEIGKTGVDGATLNAQGIEVRELVSGCICCTLVGEMTDALREIKERLSPEWLIIEATGLAYPDKTAATVREALPGLESLKVLVLADAEHFLLMSGLVPLVSYQPQHADVILLNKIDLVSREAREEAAERLRELNANASLFEASAAERLPQDFWKELLS